MPWSPDVIVRASPVATTTVSIPTDLTSFITAPSVRPTRIYLPVGPTGGIGSWPGGAAGHGRSGSAQGDQGADREADGEQPQQRW